MLWFIFANLFEKPTERRIDTIQTAGVHHLPSSNYLLVSPQSLQKCASPSNASPETSLRGCKEFPHWELIWPSLLMWQGNLVLLPCNDSFYLHTHPLGFSCFLQRWTKCFNVQMTQMLRTVSHAGRVRIINLHPFHKSQQTQLKTFENYTDHRNQPLQKVMAEPNSVGANIGTKFSCIQWTQKLCRKLWSKQPQEPMEPNSVETNTGTKLRCNQWNQNSVETNKPKLCSTQWKQTLLDLIKEPNSAGTNTGAKLCSNHWDQNLWELMKDPNIGTNGTKLFRSQRNQTLWYPIEPNSVGTNEGTKLCRTQCWTKHCRN